MVSNPLTVVVLLVAIYFPAPVVPDPRFKFKVPAIVAVFPEPEN